MKPWNRPKKISWWGKVMSDELWEKFLIDTYTKEQALRRSLLLKEDLNHRFFSSSQTITNTNTEDQSDLQWLKNMTQNYDQLFNKDNFLSKLLKLEKELAGLTVLTLFLPFTLPVEELPSLGQLVRKKFHPQLLLDIKYDPSLIGGCALAWKGVYKDYSLKTKIETNFGRRKTVDK